MNSEKPIFDFMKHHILNACGSVFQPVGVALHYAEGLFQAEV